jgi:hypothetical protein
MDPETCCKTLHVTLLGTEPTPNQLAIYRASGHFNGLANRNPSADQVEAILILGLAKVLAGGDVVVYVPKEGHRDALISHLRELGKKVVSRVPREDQKRVADYLTAKISCLKIGVASNWRVKPQLWVACFFHEKSAVPPWFKEKLLNIRVSDAVS